MDNLKALLLSFLTALSSLFFTNHKLTSGTPTNQITNTLPVITVINTPVSVSPVPSVKISPKPTLNLKPVSTVDENVLRVKFGINDQNVINTVLNDPKLLERYEKEYYLQMKGWPKIKTSASEQRIYIPSLDSVKICKSSAVDEIKSASIKVDETQTLFQQIKSKRSELLKIRTENNFLIKSAYAQGCPTNDYNCQIDKLIEELRKYESERKVAIELLNTLLSKYCR